jgi:alginate O-acetyltransferase complex protein AlgI
VRPAGDPLRFGVYVTFFSKIAAGPIVRYRDVAGQLARPRVSRSGLAMGVQRFVIGLAKKVLIADTLALVASDVFATPGQNLTAAAAWLGTICYGLLRLLRLLRHGHRARQDVRLRVSGELQLPLRLQVTR